jgi:hypothetical protein
MPYKDIEKRREASRRHYRRHRKEVIAKVAAYKKQKRKTVRVEGVKTRKPRKRKEQRESPPETVIVNCAEDTEMAQGEEEDIKRAVSHYWRRWYKWLARTGEYAPRRYYLLTMPAERPKPPEREGERRTFSPEWWEVYKGTSNWITQSSAWVENWTVRAAFLENTVQGSKLQHFNPVAATSNITVPPNKVFNTETGQRVMILVGRRPIPNRSGGHYEAGLPVGISSAALKEVDRHMKAGRKKAYEAFEEIERNTLDERVLEERKRRSRRRFIQDSASVRFFEALRFSMPADGA